VLGPADDVGQGLVSVLFAVSCSTGAATSSACLRILDSTRGIITLAFGWRATRQLRRAPAHDHASLTKVRHLLRVGYISQSRDAGHRDIRAYLQSPLLEMAVGVEVVASGCRRLASSRASFCW